MALTVTSYIRYFRHVKNKFIYFQIPHRDIHNSAATNGLFYEKEPKSGYKTDNLKDVPRTKLIRDGLKELRKEIELWKEEVKEKFEMDPICIHRPGILVNQASLIMLYLHC